MTVYAVGDRHDMRRLTGNRIVAGFYRARAGRSSAFVQDIRLRGDTTDFTLTILLHEYAHHFLMASSRYALPRWVNEGAAEFFASARFRRSGELEIGRPADHRVGELFYATEVKIRDLLDYDAGVARSDAFYGRSWLLYHFLNFEPGRSGQLRAYWEALRAGKTAIDAGEEAFGDLDKLEDDLDNYLRQRRISMLTFSAGALQPGPIEVHALSEGMNAAMPLIIQSKRGVTREMALALLPEVREVAGQYPADAGVLAALAEAEYDAGNNAEAIAAADAAIALDPSITNSYVQKGYALFSMAKDAKDKDAAYEKAMEPFIALNGLENDHPLPLIYLYRSYFDRGARLSETAKDALYQASTLAPFDDEITLATALMFAAEGDIEGASAYLEPLARNPHGGGQAEAAQKLIDAMADAREGEPLTSVPPADDPAMQPTSAESGEDQH